MSGRASTPGAQGTGGQITEAVSPGLGRRAPLPAASRLAEGRRRPTALGSQDVFHGRCQICHRRVRNAPFPLILPHVWSKSRVRRPGLPSRTGSNPAGMTGGGASGHGVCFGLLPCVILCLRPSSVRLPTYPSAPWPVCPLFSPRCVGMSHADEQQCPDAEWPRRGLRVAPHLERHREDLELGQAVPWGCGSSLCCLLRRQTRSGGHANPARTGTLQAATPSCPTRKYKGCFLGLKTPTRKAGRGSLERGPHTPRGYKS